MGEGTEDESIHHLSVQIMTTPSLVVSMMNRLHMSSRLLAGVQLATCVAASTENQPNDSPELVPKSSGHTSKIAYDSWCLRHKRYHHIVYDLLYVLRVGPKQLGATRFIVDSPTFLAGWMSILAHWSGRSKVKRQEGAHVAFENQNWVTPFNMFMLLKRISKILSKAVAQADVETDGSGSHGNDKELCQNRLRVMNVELDVMRDAVRGNASLSLTTPELNETTSHVDTSLNARYQSVGSGNVHATNDVDYWMNACLYGCDHPAIFQPSATRGLHGRTASLQCVNGIAASFFDGRSTPDAIEIVSSPLGTWHLFAFNIVKREITVHHALHRLLGRIIRDHETTMYRTFGERGARGRGCGQWLLGSAGKFELSKSRSHARTYTSKQIQKDPKIACLRHRPKGKEVEVGHGGTTDHLHWLLRLCLAEGPLRTAALFAQIRIGMWRRNGQTTSIMLNVYMTQASDCTYESDLNALMVGLVAIGADHFLAVLLEKFGVLPWLFGRKNVSGNKNDVWFKNEQYHELMMEECLKMLIIMANEAPKRQDNEPSAENNATPMTTNGSAEAENNTEFFSLLRNNLIHKLMAQARPPSVLMKLGSKLAGGQDDFEHANTTHTVRQLLRDIATLKKADTFGVNDSGGGGATFELNDEFYDEYDPYYLRLTSDEHFEAKEKWLNRRRDTKQDTVFRPSAPPVHTTLPFYDDVTSAFVTPQFVSLVRVLLLKSFSTAGLNDNLRDTLYHTLSMQCHILSTKSRPVQLRCLRAMCLSNPTEETLTFPGTVQELSVLQLLCRRAKDLSEDDEGVNGDLSDIELENLVWMLVEWERTDANHVDSGTVEEYLQPILHQLKSGEGERVREVTKREQESTREKAKVDALQKMEEQQRKFAAMMEMDDSDDDNGSSSGSDDDNDNDDDDDDGDDDEKMANADGDLLDAAFDAVMPPKAPSSPAVVSSTTSPSSSSTYTSATRPIPTETKKDSNIAGTEVCIICNELAGVESGKGAYGYVGFAQADPRVMSTPSKFPQNNEGETKELQLQEEKTPSVSVSPFLRFCSHGVHSTCLDEYKRTTRQRRMIGVQLDLLHEFTCPLCKSLSNMHVPLVSTNIQGEVIESEHDGNVLTNIAGTLSSLVSNSSSTTDEIDSMSVKDLKRALASHGVTRYDGFVEKKDFRDRLRTFRKETHKIPAFMTPLRSNSMAKVHEVAVSVQMSVPLPNSKQPDGPIPNEVFLLWRTCIRTVLSAAREGNASNVDRNVSSITALVQCARMSTQLVQDGVYVQDRILMPISTLLRSSTSTSNHPMLLDLLDVPSGDISGVSLIQKQGDGSYATNLNGVKEDCIVLAHLPSLFMAVVLFHPVVSNVLPSFCAEMVALQMEQCGLLDSVNEELSLYSVLTKWQQEEHGGAEMSEDEDGSTHRRLTLLLRTCHLVLRCVVGRSAPLPGGALSKGGRKDDVLLLVNHLDLRSALEAMSAPFYAQLTLWRKSSSTSTSSSPSTSSSTSLITVALTSREPFLFRIAKEYGLRYDQLMSPIQNWFYKTTQIKKQQVQDGEIDVKQADMIDQECACVCLLCGTYLRGGEKKNGIGACHRHIGMTPQGHQLDANDDVCEVARGGVGIFLLVDQTSVRSISGYAIVFVPSIYIPLPGLTCILLTLLFFCYSHGLALADFTCTQKVVCLLAINLC